MVFRYGLTCLPAPVHECPCIPPRLKFVAVLSCFSFRRFAHAFTVYTHLSAQVRNPPALANTRKSPLPLPLLTFLVSPSPLGHTRCAPKRSRNALSATNPLQIIHPVVSVPPLPGHRRSIPGPEFSFQPIVGGIGGFFRSSTTTMALIARGGSRRRGNWDMRGGGRRRTPQIRLKHSILVNYTYYINHNVRDAL